MHKRLVHARRQTGDARKVQRAGLQAIGHHPGLEHALGGGAGAALAQRRDVHARAHPQNAGAVRAEQALVPRHRQQIAAPGLRRKRHMARRLRAVDQEQHTASLAHLAHRLHILQGAQDVGHVRHYDEPRAREHGPLDVLRADLPLRVRRHERQRDHAAARELGQRAQHGVVLQQRGDHMIPCAHDAVNGHVERIGRVQAEGHARRVRLAQHLRRALPAALDDAPRGQ